MAISTIDSGGINQAGDTVLCTTSGNLGVGTSAPAAKLDVRGETSYLINATSPTAWISADASLSTGSIYNQWNTSSSLGVTGTYTNHPYTFVTNNTERMRIDQNGNVGINTSVLYFPFAVRTSAGSPITFAIGNESTQNLSTIYFIQAGSNLEGYTWISADARETQGYLSFNTGGTEKVRIASNGIVTGAAGNLMLVSGTAVGAGGTAVDFTDIPSWAKRVTVQLRGVSTNGTSILQIQLGDSGGIATTGYLASCAAIVSAASPGALASTTGFNIGNSNVATYNYELTAVFTLVSGTTWIGSLVGGVSSTVRLLVGTGTKTLSGALSQVRVTTVAGTNSFDAGTINILYE